MFNRYWRTYPWALQLMLFLLMMFTLMSFATFLVLVLVPKLSGVSLTDIINLGPLSSDKTARTALIAQAVTHIGTFAIPALLFVTFTHPRLREYLGLRPPGRSSHWLLVTGIMLGLIPVLVWGENWMANHLHLGEMADRLQKRNNDTISAFLKLRTPADFLLLLTVMAILPAIGEELAFRGVLLRLFHRGFRRWGRAFTPADDAVPNDPQRSMVIPVILSGMVFAFWHSSPYGFTFIFIAGCVLALIYSLTGSLYCSIWAHFLNNGLQVAAIYFTQGNEAANKVAQGDNLPIIYPIIGLVIFGASFYALVKQSTPLSPKWSNDFRPDELEAQKEQ